ncbi:MAG TPA: threonine/serine dehydratase [Gemmatimonadaceae bacterium]|nr:threonine/serine dehydratase [Gemmatimonadaceae bacterium]
MSVAWPITLDDVHAARRRIAQHFTPSPLRRYPTLDAAVGRDIAVSVKHENFNPTNSFKVRNGLSFVSALPDDARRRGVVAATRGNHGLGLAYACSLFGVKATLCVPLGNNPDKNAGMRAYGARLVEEGVDYDESLLVADRIVREEGATLAHSTNDRCIVAGAATMSLEMIEQEPALDAIVISIGGGSQAVGALTIARALNPAVEVYGVQAERAAAAHNAWHSGVERVLNSADTFADGLATRSTYEMTFPTLKAGLKDFITVSEGEIADALRLLLETTHSLVEGAGAVGLAGLLKLRDKLAGKRVAIVLSGGNIDGATLRRVLAGEI